jgi:glycosyltransferase involved in cell wall biosynthesis
LIFPPIQIKFSKQKRAALSSQKEGGSRAIYLMKIGINAQPLINAAPCGIDTYARNLVAALDQIDHKHDIILFSSDKIHLKETSLLNKVGQSFGMFSYLGFSKLFNQSQCDVALILKETVPLFVDKPVVITVYDLFFIKMYKRFKKQITFSAKLHYELAKLISFKKADALCAISESCRQDLIEFCGVSPEKIVVTPLAYDSRIFFPRSREQIETTLKKYQIELPYFLNISSVFWDPKNVMGVLRSFKILMESNYQCELIMVGKVGPSYKQMQEYIHKHKLKVTCLLSIEVEELAILLAGAKALVYPSFHEGFGLPIIEAMAVGCPVITSNISAMPETAGGAAHLINPHQPEEIFDAMKRIMEDTGFTNDLKKKGFEHAKQFSWRKTAQKTLETLNLFR